MPNPSLCQKCGNDKANCHCELTQEEKERREFWKQLLKKPETLKDADEN